MKLFDELGAAIESRWNAVDYDETKFPEIAAELLRGAELPSKVTAWDVIEWTLAQNFLPDQRDLAGNFGDPPITIYNSPRFHIDVYFWLDGTTAIHQHAFCGAFQVLHGSSIHSWYEFDRSESVNTFTEIGTMNLKLCELLSVGDVQAINAGKSYIHALFHLDHPSATIVIRTFKSPMYLPQYSYYKPYLAVDPFFEDPATTKKMQCVVSMIRIRHPKADEYVRDWIRSSDFQTTFQILSNVRGHIRSNKLEQMFGLSTPEDRFRSYLDAARERHGERANVFPAVFEHLDKQDEIVQRRMVVTEPEHRFFLALLLNAEGRERIFSLVSERFPDKDPMDKVLDWVYDLGATRLAGEAGGNVIGIDGFDDIDVSILEAMFRGVEDSRIQSLLTNEFGAGEIADLSARINKIRASVILQPLLI